MTESTEPQGNPKKRRAILDAASTVFLRDGYARASVDVIAAEAKVSKQTVYNHFGDKEALFVAVTSRVQDEAVVQIFRIIDEELPDPEDLADAGDLRAALIRLTSEWIRAVYTGPLVDLRKLVDSESEHHPGLRRRWLDNGPRRTVPRLNRVLVGLARAGLLDVPEDVLADPDLLAHQLTTGTGMDVRRITPDADDFEAEFERKVTQGVDFFLRAYAPRGARAGKRAADARRSSPAKGRRASSPPTG